MPMLMPMPMLVPVQLPLRTLRHEISFPGLQEEFVKALIETGKPVVVVMTNGRPLASEYIKASAAAVLEAWFAGEEGGNAIADVLS